MNKVFRVLRSPQAAVGVFVLALGSAAHAALPTAATTAITGLGTDSLAMIDAYWPVIAVVAAVGNAA